MSIDYLEDIEWLEVWTFVYHSDISVEVLCKLRDNTFILLGSTDPFKPFKTFASYDEASLDFGDEEFQLVGRQIVADEVEEPKATAEIPLKVGIQPIEHPDYWEIPVQGREVSRCCIDYAFSFDLLEQDNIGIKIEGPFLIRVDGKEYQLDAGEQVTNLGPALSILHQTVTSLHIFNSGVLEVRFANDIKLVVNPNPPYEAWQLWGDHGVMFVCLPSGGLAIWGDW